MSLQPLHWGFPHSSLLNRCGIEEWTPTHRGCCSAHGLPDFPEEADQGKLDDRVRNSTLCTVSAPLLEVLDGHKTLKRNY